MHRYSNIDYVLNKDIPDGIAFIYKAIEKRDNERYFMQWVVQLPYMEKNTFISFEDYKLQVTGRNICTKPKEEILAKAEEIERKSRAKRGE